MADRSDLLRDLDAAREAFLEVLGDVDLELATVPGAMEDWSVRDLVYHVAVWCEHGSEAVDLAAHGRAESFAYSSGDTDAMNASWPTAGRSPRRMRWHARKRPSRAFALESPGSTRR